MINSGGDFCMFSATRQQTCQLMEVEELTVFSGESLMGSSGRHVVERYSM
jgi:hypothetical protein